MNKETLRKEIRDHSIFMGVWGILITNLECYWQEGPFIEFFYILNSDYVLFIPFNPYSNPVGKHSLDYLSHLPKTTQSVNGRDHIQSWVNFIAISTVLEVLHTYVIL